MHNTKTIYVLLGVAFVIALVLGVWWFTASHEATPEPVPTGGLQTNNSPLSLVSTNLKTSPATIEGSAPGTWYFEGSFPVTLLDGEGVEIGRGIARAKGDWMTEAQVPFSISLTFAEPRTATGTLVLRKDNPSGLPQNDMSRSFEVTFK